jgi:hypothetical protein
VLYCNAMLIPVFNVMFMPMLNSLGHRLFKPLVVEISGKRGNILEGLNHTRSEHT